MHLSVQLIGAPQFQLDRVPLTPGRRAVVALLSYLAVRGMEHPGQRYTRESLASLLWTEYDTTKALANLRHTLWEVTKLIGEGWVLTEHESVFLNPGAELTLDVAQFRSLLRQAAAQPDRALRLSLLAEAARLYRDEFMSGFSLKEGSNFNEWVSDQAERLRRGFADALHRLLDEYMALGQIPAAIPYAQRLIALDPTDEGAQRRLMELYARTGQTPAAIKQYQSLEKLLRRELNLDPQPETRELYKRIRKGELKPLPDPAKSPPQMLGTQPAHNLPLHLTAFIGRRHEREEISRLLAHNRLVTLIGAGGIGKTRLALEIAHSSVSQYPDGVWFISLEALADEDLVPRAVASALHIPEPADVPLIEHLAAELRRKTLLLIFDNCEHLLDACARLAESLLRNSSTVKILATSREVLGLEGEAVYHVPPLAVPESDAPPSFDAIAGSESVQLFARRASLVLSGFEITKENAASLVRICNRLDGLPLAIELAASHADIFTLEEILEQLNRSFDLLVSHHRSVLPRHQTMRASIDWGWNLLTEAERTFIRRLSVFPGGWTLHAAQGIGVQDSLERTRALWKKSLVVVHRQAGYDTRYGFHEVVRSYAREKLVEAGEETAIRDLQLDYYLALLRGLEPALHGIEQDAWLERLFLERDNIRAALEWAARTNLQAGLYLSHRLRTLWEQYELREEASWLLTI